MPNYRVLLAALGAAALTSVLLFRAGANPVRGCSGYRSDLRAMDLRGRWVVELIPDSARELPSARLGHPLGGSLQIASRDSSASGVVYSGEYNADFQSIGLYKKIGEVLAFTPSGDTLRLILDPNVDHGNVELVARCDSASLGGRWTGNGDPSTAWGHFRMR